MKEEQVNEKKIQLIVFKLAGQEYGLFIHQVKEVVLTPAITPVPLTPTYIKGVANVRGDILAMIDLVERFGLKPQEASAPAKQSFSLVLAKQGTSMALLTQELPHTLSLYESALIQPNLVYEQEEEKNYILYIARLEERLIIVIDVDRIILKEDVQAAVGQG